MPALIGLDVGTTGTKAVVVDEKGIVLGSATAEYPLFLPFPLWSEQNPSDWWTGSCNAIQTALKNASIFEKDVIGIGLTGQMHGAVFLDEEFSVIRPAILWNDQRTFNECDEITARIGSAKLIEITGNPALTGFQAPKILWLRKNEPENYSKIRYVLLPKDYIRFLLSGVLISDASDAAGTLLLDLQKRNWSNEILDKLEIPVEWLPKVVEGPDLTGSLKPSVAQLLGLNPHIPIVGGGGDNAAAAVGTGIVTEGIVSSSIGTSGVIFAHIDKLKFDPRGRLHTFCHAVPNKYHLMAVTLSAGGSFRWMRDIILESARIFDKDLAEIINYDEMTTLASTIPPGSEGLYFLPYLNGERTPHLDPMARGGFVGLTSRHHLGHMVRAVMEGVTYSLRDGLEIMKSIGIEINQVRVVGGGGKSALWRQMQADIFNQEIVTLQIEEGPAYGAALLAGVGVGVFKDVYDAVERCVRITDVIKPNPHHQERYEQGYLIYKNFYPRLSDIFRNISNSVISLY